MTYGASCFVAFAPSLGPRFVHSTPHLHSYQLKRTNVAGGSPGMR